MKKAKTKSKKTLKACKTTKSKRLSKAGRNLNHNQLFVQG